MSTDTAVLCALLRLARRRAPATLADLLDRVGADAPDVQRSLASLARAGLVQRVGGTCRLSLAGLAVAVAASRFARAAVRPVRAGGASPSTSLAPSAPSHRAA